jgi:transposase
MNPVYEQIKSELAEIKAELAETKRKLCETTELLKLALEEIADLREKLNLNSKNSSKPPSTDQKANTPPKQRKKREPRQGIARSNYPPERVDRSVECTRENCPHCGSQSIQKDGTPEAFQQAELPEVRAIITEYLLHKYSCSDCGRKSVAYLPTGVPDSAFGPRLMGLFATLTGALHVAKREAIQLMKDLYGVDIGLGSAPNIEERVAKALDPVYGRINNLVIEGPFCKHFDETTWRDSGKRCYVWVASCSMAAFFKLHANRSRKAFEELVGKEADGFEAVTDRYAVYATIGKLHQYCLAHLIREFRRYAERDGPDGERGEALAQELVQVCRIHKDYREGKSSRKQRNRRIGHRKRRVEFWLDDGFANGSDQLSGLCERLLNDFNKLWTFTKVEGMEPTNNLAERDLRKLVIWRKKSFGTRSGRGQKFVERITSIVETAKRHGRNALSFIQDAVACFFAGKPAPHICESLGI